jgi:hypothetical protein
MQLIPRQENLRLVLNLNKAGLELNKAGLELKPKAGLVLN